MSLRVLWQRISPSEWRLLAAITVLLIFLTTAPAVYGVLVTPPDQQFTGMHFVSADDWFVYFSFINQAKDGALLLSDLFAPVEHIPTLRPLWTAVGLLAALLHISAPMAFHLARIILIPAFLTVSYLLLCYFFDSARQRRLALLFLAFSSGLGVFMVHRLARFPLNYVESSFRWPMDLWVPDINTFLTLHTSPHFILSTVLLVLIFLFSLLYAEQPRFSYAVWAGLAGLLLFFEHPFQVVKVFVILGAFWFLLIITGRRLNWHHLWFVVIFSLLVLPALLYYVLLLQLDPLTLDRTLQNLNPSAPPHLLLVSLGGLAGLAAVGLWRLWLEKKLFVPKYAFLWLWLLLQILLLYAPISYQRRTGLGMHIPLVLLSVIALGWLEQRYAVLIKRHFGAVVMAAVLIFLPSTAFALAADVMVYSQARELSYVSHDSLAAFVWLSDNTPPGTIIFADVKTGNVLPAYVNRTSYVGHAVETPGYVIKKREPLWLFERNRDSALEADWLKQRGIDYIFYGPREQALGAFNPNAKAYLEKVFTTPSVQLFRVL